MNPKPQHPEKLSTALSGFDALPDSAHVRAPVVADWKGISVPTVWRWAKSGLLPAPVKIGPRVTAWNVGQLRRARQQAA